MTLVGGALASFGSVFLILFVLNYLRERDSRSAASRSTESITGVISGVAAVGVIVATDLLGAIVAALFTAPDALFTLLLGIVGYLSIDGVLSITPETWGILTIIMFVLVVVGKDVITVSR